MYLFLMLTSIVLGFSLLPNARAAMTISLIPDSGNVGSTVALVANLTTNNGAYNVTFEGAFLNCSGNAIGNQVNATFTVPETTSGNHTVTIIDLNSSDTAVGFFIVSTAYSLNVTVPQAPQRLQENDSVPIVMGVTGGNTSISYNANITVSTPANVACNGTLNIPISALGSGEATLFYPDNFTSGANTTYVGNYAVSAVPAVSPKSFFVGLTNSTQYHRTQTIDIKAVYAPNENVTITLSGNGIQNSTNLLADSAGLIHYTNWTVPTAAPIGTYNVSIVSVSNQTVKVPPDTQNFTVPGFSFNVTAKNLAGETVPNVTIEAFENGHSVSNQTTSNETATRGLAAFILEIGKYTLQGYSEGVKVGQNESDVSGNETVDFVLNLTDLNIRVVASVNGAEIGIPEAGIYVTSPTGNLTFTTDIDGNVVAQSLLPSNTYTLNVSRYGIPFNVTPTSIASLLVAGSLVPFFNVTVNCPSYSLYVSAFKADGQPLSGAVVKADELLGGIQYDETTGSNGIAVFQNVTFGNYAVTVLDRSGIKLNSTTVGVFQDQNVTVDCNLFGFNITFTVTDYFGQPFANANVTLLANGAELISQKTQANGVTTFDGSQTSAGALVGESFTVSVYLSNQGSPTVVQNLHVDGSTPIYAISIRIGRYVLLAGLPVETTQFAVAVLIALSLLLTLSLEAYKRRRSKSKKTGT
jgi:hypothetical protein